MRILAVDIPSGVSADTGEVLGVALPADATVTFAFNKTGLATGPGRSLAGTLTVADIGIYDPSSTSGLTTQ
jgi:NAD(P)H-hydrate epimerase